jgi:arginine/ornithine N-succinyltransferase beta subunit
LKAQLTTSKEVAEAPSLILSNNTLTNYRMTLANGMVDEESVSLDEQTMQRLQVNVGELVRVVEA